MTFDDIPKIDIITLIQKIQKTIKCNPSIDEITFEFKDNTTLYYKINGKTQGNIIIRQNLSENSDKSLSEKFKIEISAQDSLGLYPFLSGINKAVYWRLNMHLKLVNVKLIIQENKKIDLGYKKYRETFQIVAEFNNNLSLNSIETFIFNTPKHTPDIFYNKTILSSVEEEDYLAKMKYYEFKNPQEFKEIFHNYLNGPITSPLSMADIQSRLLLLESINL